MARYSCVTQLMGSAEQLSEAIRAVLERCQLTVLHNSPDYWVAGEPPGKNPYAKLVTVEVFVDRTRQAADGSVQVTCIAKNEELPLRSVNHCQQTFDQLRTELAQLQAQLQLAARQKEAIE
ncbi:hypothetical protein ACVW0Q_001461 [Thermostichus sp. MS-CIW-21]|jgi:hypothetical protein|uniref:hypothetical protein n=1 Tax=unclassified Synechococcus TaxID=2626047 RepID=UPI00006946E6|nr:MULTISPECIES: hypothetical protein [unclassified Synechococcus]ABD00352.1 conserved hypothetical protein [Synechococcus sp. JA-3-3Ab]PIK86795.1 hypothetical protein SYN63AY4M2_10380 [Synechococcus sp. 63AY4M2]PIK87708.1 hypothetical protein SYN65AY6A5_00640 [Synechococcus sp. 65AY6A5]PIK92151.1 hypothetical protein SYN65AY6LI_07875 [Synechococcus sp. 65AY6Li]PIK95864.1 hypothetical protein SYN60AY4M2_10995 [Synechococcus sp. 60AY4M2]